MTRPTLVLVHGRAQQGRDPEAVKAEWLETLRRGLGHARQDVLTGLDVRLPFYGDVLEKFARDADEAIPADILVRGRPDGVDEDYLRFREGYLGHVRLGLGITDEQANLFVAEDARSRGPAQWEWVQALLRAADAVPGVSADAIERFTRDVFLYLSRSKIRREINRIVADAIPRSRTLVIGHSLGSVVAFDVLRSLDPSAHVPLLVTVGSPLGVGPIRRTLQPLRFPAGVETWFNALDERDVVALQPLDGTTFAVDPPIDNYTGVRNRTENAHGISGYLDDPQVATRIYEALMVPDGASPIA